MQVEKDVQKKNPKLDPKPYSSWDAPSPQTLQPDLMAVVAADEGFGPG